MPVCGGSTSSADVAQLVEQLIRNQQVIGSSPIVGSSLISFLYPKDLPQELDTAGGLCGQCASIHKADSRGVGLRVSGRGILQAWGIARTVIDCAGKLVKRVLLVLPPEGAVTVTFGFETIALRFAAL